MIVRDPYAEKLKEHYARKCAVSEKLTNMSQLTSKTFISTLQRQLDDERNARTKLESELKVLKDLSAEISQHLKLNPNAKIV